MFHIRPPLALCDSGRAPINRERIGGHLRELQRVFRPPWVSPKQSARGSPSRPKQFFTSSEARKPAPRGATMWLCGLLFGPVIPVLAAAPAASASDPAALPTPTNLKVLPKDISPAQLRRTMDGFRDDLGVTCGYCHTRNPQTQKFDYASDEKPDKQTTRIMIRMLNDINDKYLQGLGDRRYSTPVTCGSCHQGESTPPPFEPK